MILFFKKSVPASFNGALSLAGYTGETLYQEAGDTPIALFVAQLTEPLTAGTVVVTLARKGSTVATVSLAAGTPFGCATPTHAGLRAGDRLAVNAVASADLAPVTTDLLAVA